MPRNWPGLGERIKQRVEDLGFKNIAQFADAKGYRITYAYKWAAGTTPDRENLERLARDLQVHPAWLLFGDEILPLVRRAKKALACLVGGLLLGASVQASAAPLPAVERASCEKDYVKARRRRRNLMGWLYGNTPREFPRLVPLTAIG